jgi:hypothetical protein
MTLNAVLVIASKESCSRSAESSVGSPHAVFERRTTV